MLLFLVHLHSLVLRDAMRDMLVQGLPGRLSQAKQPLAFDTIPTIIAHYYSFNHHAAERTACLKRWELHSDSIGGRCLSRRRRPQVLENHNDSQPDSRLVDDLEAPIDRTLGAP